MGNYLELEKTANEIRKGIVTAVHSAKSGHPGGSLSAADLFTWLYFREMNIDPEYPAKEDRDRFVLSKGHVAPGYYSTLANRGFFPVSRTPAEAQKRLSVSSGVRCRPPDSTSCTNSVRRALTGAGMPSSAATCTTAPLR